MPRGHEHDPIYSFSIYAHFSGQFFAKLWKRKIVVPCLDAIIGTLRYSGRGRGGRQPEVKCSILGTN